MRTYLASQAGQSDFAASKRRKTATTARMCLVAEVYRRGFHPPSFGLPLLRKLVTYFLGVGASRVTVNDARITQCGQAFDAAKEDLVCAEQDSELVVSAVLSISDLVWQTLTPPSSEPSAV